MKFKDILWVLEFLNLKKINFQKIRLKKAIKQEIFDILDKQAVLKNKKETERPK